MQIKIKMNRLLVLLYSICLVHTQVPQNSVNSVIVNDINGDSHSGGSYLAREFDSEVASETHHQKLLEQHRLRHNHQQVHQNHHQSNKNHNNQHTIQQHAPHGNHNEHHHQSESQHHVDEDSHNDNEIGHIQPNMVKFYHKQYYNWGN